jgi:hypothetical protein
LTQSMSEWPGFRATLLRGFPETRNGNYRISAISSRRPVSTPGNQPTTFCGLIFGSHLGAATAPRHDADRYWRSRGGTKHKAAPHSTGYSWFYSVTMFCCLCT